MMTIAGFTLIEALRSRVLRLALLVAFLGFFFSLFLQQIAITESRQIQSGALAVTARLGGVFVIVSFAVSGMLREYQEKGLEFFLAMAIGRTRYFFGKLMGYAACSLMLSVLLCLPMLWSNAVEPVLIWGISLFLELLLMSSVSLFFSITLVQLPAALVAVSGFYLLSRSMGTLMLIMNGPLSDHGLLQSITDGMISVIGFLLPSLDEFTKTAWLVYPAESNWRELFPVFLQTVIYLMLMSSAALFDFQRREI